MLKQRGQWHASGPRPKDLGLEYDNLFNHEVEDMAEMMTSESTMTSSEARHLLSSAFQVMSGIHYHILLEEEKGGRGGGCGVCAWTTSTEHTNSKISHM